MLTECEAAVVEVDSEALAADVILLRAQYSVAVEEVGEQAKYDDPCIPLLFFTNCGL